MRIPRIFPVLFFALCSFVPAKAALAVADPQNGMGAGISTGLHEECDLANATLHGLVGCAAGEAMGGNCGAGFAAGVAQSVYAGMVDGTGPDKNDVAAYNAWRQEVSEQAKLIGGTVGYLTLGGRAANVYNGGSIAQSGVVNNYLSHTESWALEHAREAVAACETSSNCDASQIERLET